MTTIKMEDAIRINKEKGHHWFDSETMAKFGSKLETEMLEGNFFVSSEQDTKGIIGEDGKRYKAYNGRRRFSTHRFNVESGTVLDISEFCEFASLKSALKSISRFNPKVQIGDRLRIVMLDDSEADRYEGRTGRIEGIDDLGQIHGSWGGLALIPSIDVYELI